MAVEEATIGKGNIGEKLCNWHYQKACGARVSAKLELRVSVADGGVMAGLSGCPSRSSTFGGGSLEPLRKRRRISCEGLDQETLSSFKTKDSRRSWRPSRLANVDASPAPNR